MSPAPLRPFALFDRPEIILGKGGAFAVSLSPELAAADVSLVIDIYDLENLTHPGGHLGWWKFPAVGMGKAAAGTIGLAGGVATLDVDGLTPIASWRNPSPVRCRGLAVSLVLRANTTNAIVHMDRVPAFGNKAGAKRFRAAWSRNYASPRFAAPGYVAPAGATVHIAAPNIFRRDAVGALCLDIFRMLRQNGIAAEIYADNYNLEMNDVVRRLDALPSRTGPADQILYFASTHDPHLDAVLAAPCRRRIAFFHGITDPLLLRVFNPELSAVCERALAQLPRLAEFDALAANSRTMARQLVASFGDQPKWRAADVAVIAPKLIAGLPPPPAVPKPVARGAKFLTVGRVKSHKKLEDVLALFAAYLALDPDAECWILGGDPDRPYRDYLDWVERVDLSLPKGKVKWLGSVDETNLAKRYAGASAYISMSEHEGFCLPLLEAMLQGLPIFAYAIEAVLETLGGAGVSFEKKEFPHLAAAIHARLSDPARLAALVERQYAHASAIAATMGGSGFLELLAPARL